MYTLYLPSSILLAIIDYMKRTFAILMLFSVMLTLSAATYYVGAEGGLAVNTVVAGKGYRNYKYSAEVGFKSSVPVLIMFTDNLGLDTGLAMYGKNYKSYQTVTVDGKKQVNYNLEVNNGYLELPIAFRASLPIKNFNFYLSVGGYMGAWLYGSRSGTVVNGNDKVEEVNETTDLSLYNRFDAGLLARIGADVGFGAFKLYAQYEYAFSVTDMNKSQKYGAYPIHNSTFSITLGALWGINK